MSSSSNTNEDTRLLPSLPPDDAYVYSSSYGIAKAPLLSVSSVISKLTANNVAHNTVGTEPFADVQGKEVHSLKFRASHSRQQAPSTRRHSVGLFPQTLKFTDQFIRDPIMNRPFLQQDNETYGSEPSVTHNGEEVNNPTVFSHYDVVKKLSSNDEKDQIDYLNPRCSGSLNV